MQDNIAVLREWIAGSDNIVFFGGRRGRVHGIPASRIFAARTGGTGRNINIPRRRS